MGEIISNVYRYTIQVSYNNNKTWISTCFSFSSLKEAKRVIKKMKSNIETGNSLRIIKRTEKDEVVYEL